jgi:hypothetical protein
MKDLDSENYLCEQALRTQKKILDPSFNDTSDKATQDSTQLEESIKSQFVRLLNTPVTNIAHENIEDNLKALKRKLLLNNLKLLEKASFHKS